MKMLLGTLLSIVFSVSARAAALDTDARAIVVKDLISSAVLSLPGSNGIGITGCDPVSGQLVQFDGSDKPFVHCVVIYTSDLGVVKGFYPNHTQIKGVSIVARLTEMASIHPRMTAGN